MKSLVPKIEVVNTIFDEIAGEIVYKSMIGYDITARFQLKKGNGRNELYCTAVFSVTKSRAVDARRSTALFSLFRNGLPMSFCNQKGRHLFAS